MTGFFAFAAGRLAPGLALRPAAAADGPLLAQIYATTRTQELAVVPWTDEQKKAFTDWQSAQQEAHYALHFPEGERLLVEREGRAIGRIYIHTRDSEVQLMEVTLLPPFRNQGLGTRLLELVLAYADGLGRPVSLHVEPFNPAKRMYERVGFAVVETHGLYQLMVRPDRTAA